MTFDDKTIARVVHEAGFALCQEFGDDSWKHWEETDGWRVKATLDQIQAYKKAISRGETFSPRKDHEIWLNAKKAAGWKYGPVKDAEKKEHPLMVDFDQLPPFEKFKNDLYTAILQAFLNFEAAQSSAHTQN